MQVQCVMSVADAVIFGSDALRRSPARSVCWMQAAERKAVTMSMLLREEVEGAEDHRPVTCRFVVDEVRLSPPAERAVS